MLNYVEKRIIIIKVKYINSKERSRSMEVVRIEVSEEQKSKGAIKSFSIRAVEEKDLEYANVHEFPKYYQIVIIKEERMDQLDLSTILFDFVISDVFDETKPLTFEKNFSVMIPKKADYTVIFQKLNPLFQKK